MSRPPRTWVNHPAFADQKPTLGTRAADRMKAVFATWTALLAILAAMGVWIATGGFGSDPKPFILLNLCLSCLAALQCFILLIAAKRQDQIASELAEHDYRTNVEAKAEIEALQALTREIHAAVVKASEPPDTVGGSRVEQR